VLTPSTDDIIDLLHDGAATARESERQYQEALKMRHDSGFID